MDKLYQLTKLILVLSLIPGVGIIPFLIYSQLLYWYYPMHPRGIQVIIMYHIVGISLLVTYKMI